MNKENTRFCLSNKFFFNEKENYDELAEKLHVLVHNWVHSHFKWNKIINTQISDQCEKILGRNIDDAVKILEHFESKENFDDVCDLKKEFKTRFVIASFINQIIINKHCITDSK